MVSFQVCKTPHQITPLLSCLSAFADSAFNAQPSDSLGASQSHQNHIYFDFIAAHLSICHYVMRVYIDIFIAIPEISMKKLLRILCLIYISYTYN